MSPLGRFERLLEERLQVRSRLSGSDADPHERERPIHLAEALSATERLRVVLDEGFGDRDRAFEYVLARLPNVSPDRERAERAEAALAERTSQLAEALFAASVRGDAFTEGLADRDLRFAATEAVWEKRLLAETRRHEALRDERRRIEDLLEARSVELAESLIAAERTREVVREALRVSGEAFALVRARLEVERKASIKQPTFVRRLARAFKRAVPSPFARVARAARRRVSRR